jgi:hypothetical protein
MSEEQLQELRFQSPSALNESTETLTGEKPIWVHAECKAQAEKVALGISPTDWTVYCSICGASARIDEWEVDESNYLMKMKHEQLQGSFKPLDYPFSVSMIGQIVPHRELLSYLENLQSIYNTTPEEKKQDTPQDPGG